MKTRKLLVYMAISVLSLAGVSVKATETIEMNAGNLSGLVLDAHSKDPVVYATIAVYNAADSTLTTGTITADDGRFQLKDLNYGTYYAQVNFIGYEIVKTPPFELNRASREIDLGEILIREANLDLGEVVVSAERSRVEYRIDRRVINVDKDISARGGSAASVLENTPSIQLDPQGNVTLRGSSDYVVLIDGKPSPMKGSDVLKQISASSIKQIEVITNPSARFDADGQAGIINIIMHKDKLAGLNGSVNLSADSRHNRTGNLLLNYRLGKINQFGAIEFTDNTFRNDLDIDNLIMLSDDPSFYTANAVQFNENYNLGFRYGVDYDINEMNTLTIAAGFSNQGYDNGQNGRYHIWNETSTSNNHYLSNNLFDIAGNVLTSNADFQHKFSDDKTLNISATYFRWDGTDNNLLTETSYDPEGLLNEMAKQLGYKKKDVNYHFRTNIDYKQPLWEGNLEAGAQFRLENRDENFSFNIWDKPGDTWYTDDLYTYNLDYSNLIYSGYATYSGNIKGIGYQLGIRSELFERDITLSNRTEPYSFSKFMVYPSVHFSKSFGEHQSMQLSYSRRINRPQPWLLNDIPKYIDSNNIILGSTSLKPEFTDAFEFNYRVVLPWITVSSQTYFRHATNVFGAIRYMRDDGVMIHQLANSTYQDSYGEEIGFDFQPFTWWQINTSANIYHYSLNTLINNTEQTGETNTWDGRIVSNFNLKWGTRLQAIGYYRAPNDDIMGRNSGFFTANFSANQSFLKGKANIGLSVRDAFNSIKFDYTTRGANYDNHYTIHVEGPIVILNFTYTFNNFQNHKRGRADDIDFKGGGAF